MHTSRHVTFAPVKQLCLRLPFSYLPPSDGVRECEFGSGLPPA